MYGLFFVTENGDITMKAEFYLKSPADNWEKGLPVGNGKVGAVVYGGIGKETLLINEESFWFGRKQERTQPLEKGTLEHIRELLSEGKVEEAEFLSKMHLSGAPKYINPYMPAAFMDISFYGMSHEVTDYRRTLDMENGVVTVEFLSGDVRHRRTYFADFKTGTICVRLETIGKNGLTFMTNLNRRPFEEVSRREDEMIFLEGNLGGHGRDYTVAVRLGKTDGEVCSAGDYLAVRNASCAELYLWAGTKDAGYPSEEARERCEEAAAKGFDALLEKNSAKFRELFGRMEFTLRAGGQGADAAETAADVTENGTIAIADFSADELLADAYDPAKAARLSELLFHYGRYLLISSSLECRYPANLQGIWNGSYTPSWESAYTININLQMNYWMADACGLSECWKPLLELLERMVENGRVTAKEVYGCRGTVAHHNTNIWGDTDLEGLWQPAGVWPMGYAWLCQELYRHFTYRREPELKARVQRVMGEAVLFFYDYLWKKGSVWQTGPSVSPENTYELQNGSRGNLCMAPSMDTEILRELCSSYLDCAKESEAMPEIRTMAQEILTHLPAVSVAPDGRIMEWSENYVEAEPGHRHISHLYSLYPGKDWNFENKTYLDAAEKTLRTRLANGGGHTGWSRIWILCFFARLGKNKDFGEQLISWFKHSVYENLWDAHPPFQIDGNLGYCAAVTEALVQRIGERIYLLPALPDFWAEGSMKGICLSDGVKIDISWKSGELTEVTLTALWDQKVTLIHNGKETEVELKSGEAKRFCRE